MSHSRKLIEVLQKIKELRIDVEAKQEQGFSAPAFQKWRDIFDDFQAAIEKLPEKNLETLKTDFQVIQDEYEAFDRFQKAKGGLSNFAMSEELQAILKKYKEFHEDEKKQDMTKQSILKKLTEANERKPEKMSKLSQDAVSLYAELKARASNSQHRRIDFQYKNMVRETNLLLRLCAATQDRINAEPEPKESLFKNRKNQLKEWSHRRAEESRFLARVMAIAQDRVGEYTDHCRRQIYMLNAGTDEKMIFNEDLFNVTSRLKALQRSNTTPSSIKNFVAQFLKEFSDELFSALHTSRDVDLPELPPAPEEFHIPEAPPAPTIDDILELKNRVAKTGVFFKEKTPADRSERADRKEVDKSPKKGGLSS
jgi:hypothetical protein